MGNKQLRDDKGRIVTTEQAEREYRKSLIVAGKPLEGPEYDAGLQQWYGTYREVTDAEKRSTRAGFIAGGVCILVTAFIALIAAFLGGVVGFLVVAVVGLIVSVLVNLFVSGITTPKKA